ncbi:hypothetical protein [Stygiolobus caldivivus]|uniref:Uncharacterized protein n=1 Tax=Stygiolobus caldivivus TaxID=2824673 RepID=A0A8D5U5E5_9CREN|nr:hypothetical protein [Stygiolobus caldivivus]BCU69380.1 hypothetical protein KN1_06770 [Stygiolobus caldivivus]
MEKQGTSETKGVRMIYTGLVNLSLKLLTSPLSFIFMYLVAHYLSNLKNGIVLFATWQSIFVLIMGYFTIPSDIFSLLTSRYSAENKPVGGALIVNLVSGIASTIVYIILVPYFMQTLGYYDPLAFLVSSLLIVTFYINKVVTAITRGRKPIAIGIASSLFQISRLSFVLLAFYFLHLTIVGVALAYVIGYIAQTIYNLSYINSNLKIDLSITKSIIKKSIVTIIYYLQLIVEASLVWLTLLITHNSIIVSYFESALIIANIVGWSGAVYDGLIAKLGETKSKHVVETAVKLYFIASALFLLLTIVEAHALLYHIRPEYVLSFYTIIILSLSNFVRNLYTIFYYSIFMIDKTMGVEDDLSFKGYTASLNKSNLIFSGLGVFISIVLVYLFRDAQAYIISAIMTIGLLVNSSWMLFSSFKLSKKLYNFKIPSREIISSTVTVLVVILIMWRLSNNVSYEWMVINGIISSGLFLLLTYLLNPFGRSLVKASLREVRKILMSRM